MQCAGWAEKSMPMLMESVVPDSEKSVVTRNLVPVFLSCSTTLTSTARRGKMGVEVERPFDLPLLDLCSEVLGDGLAVFEGPFMAGGDAELRGRRRLLVEAEL